MLPAELKSIGGVRRNHRGVRRPAGDRFSRWLKRDERWLVPLEELDHLGEAMPIAATAWDYLGPHGRVLAATRRAYGRVYPDHVVYFDGCLWCDGCEIWCGDINLTMEEGVLEDLAREIGRPLYVTPELPYRFQGFSPEDAAADDRVRRFPSAGQGEDAAGHSNGGRAG